MGRSLILAPLGLEVVVLLAILPAAIPALEEAALEAVSFATWIL